MDTVYLRIYDRISTLIPESHEMILPEDEFEYMGFDSLDMAELIMWAEGEFDVDIREAGLDKACVETVGEFAEFIESIKED